MGFYIIASSKPWNAKLADDLNPEFADHTFRKVKNNNELESLVHTRIAQDLEITALFFVHWNWMIPKCIHNKFECIVFHTGFLPQDRGMEPIQHLIDRGEKWSWVNALKAVEDVDAGPIYMRQDVRLHGTAEEIYIRLNDIIFGMIKKFLRYPTAIVEKPQIGPPKVFPKRLREDSSIEGITTLGKLYDHIRMLDATGYPYAYLDCGVFRLKFSRATRKVGHILADVRIEEREPE